MNGTLIKAIDSVGDPPLPIPNREVKPVSADGTAKICGRVGHRHFLERELQAIEALFFLLLIPLVCLGRWYCKDLWESSGIATFWRESFKQLGLSFFCF